MGEARRAAIFAAGWLAVVASLGAITACYGHNCDGDVINFGRADGEGRLLDQDSWESGPIDGDWLDFPRQRVYIFDLHQLGDRQPEIVVPYVSANKNPLKNIDNFTIGAGNIAEISGADRGHVTIKNDTCADYFLRAVVTAAPRPPSASDTADAAADAAPTDAGSRDAEAGP